MNRVIGGVYDGKLIKLDSVHRCLYIKNGSEPVYLVKDNVVKYEVKEARNTILSSPERTCVIEWSGSRKSIIVVEKAYLTFLIRGAELYKEDIDKELEQLRPKNRLVSIIAWSITIVLGVLSFVILHNSSDNTKVDATVPARLTWTSWEIDGDLPTTDSDVFVAVDQDNSGYKTEDGASFVMGRLYNNTDRPLERVAISIHVYNQDNVKIDTCRGVLQFSLRPEGIWNYRSACGAVEDWPVGSYLVINSIEH